MRIVFMGTPRFAVSVLEIISGDHQVVAAVSQPDRAKDRKGNLLNTPLKEYASSKGIPVYQFEKIGAEVDTLKALNADVFITAAYGQILPQDILNIPRYGILNVHASLLPKYRGSSPIQTAILNGEKITGVTIMQTALGMDTGDILAAEQVDINGMNAGELSEVLAEMGGKLLLDVLKKIENNTIIPIKQDDSLATKCRKISKESAEIDWNKTSSEIYDMIRAFNPSPVAYTLYNGQRIKIYSAECVDYSSDPGKVLISDKNDGLVVACGEGALRIKSLQAPGKRVMTSTEFLNGNKITVGESFGK